MRRLPGPRTTPQSAVRELYLEQLERLAHQADPQDEAVPFDQLAPREIWRRIDRQVKEVEALAATLSVASPDPTPPTTAALTVWSHLRETTADLANHLAFFLARSAPPLG